MGEVLFYHLSRSPAEAVLGQLLPRALAQGWRVAVRGTDAARLARLDDWLWLHPEEGFLPHGLAGGRGDSRQPILLTTAAEAPNRPQALVALDRAEVRPDEAAGLERVWVLFDGADTAALAEARGLWRRLREAGIAPQYWTEDKGRWIKKDI